MTQTKRPIIPASIVSLAASLIVEIQSNKKPSATFYSKADWMQNISSPDRLLVLDQELASEKMLSSFADFRTKSEFPSLIICSDRICSRSNLIAFAALEVGFRVFLVVESTGDTITPSILRLMNSGITVLSKKEFEAETEFSMGSS